MTPTHGGDAREERRPRGEAAPAPHVEVGWMVHGWAGDPIGEVVERSSDSIVVHLNSIEAEEVRLPLRLVGSEDADARRVTLSVDTSELDEVKPRADQVRLADGDG